MHTTWKTVIAIICIAVITSCIVYIGSIVGGGLRLDLTENKLFTLSGGTGKIISNLQDPLTFRLYYARTAARKGPEAVRYFNNYFNYVNDLLEEYVHASRGKISLRVIDPRPDTDNEEDAINYGLKRFPITEEETFFFGLVVTTETGAEKSIPFFAPDRQAFIEYDITKLIYTVNNPQKKKIGILSSLPVHGDAMSDYLAQMMRMQGKEVKASWLILDAMKEFYEIVPLDTGNPDMNDIDGLLVIHPKHFRENTLFAIDQYVLQGGNAVFLVDPFCLADEPPRDPNNPYAAMTAPRNSDLNTLFETWGVQMPEGEYAGDRNLAKVVRTSQFGQSALHIGVMTLDEQCVNKDELIVSELQDMLFFFPGSLQPVELDEEEQKQISISPIISTTEEGNTYQASAYEMNSPDALVARFTPGKEPVVMGYRITGRFKSAFPDGILEVKDSTEGEPGLEEKRIGLIASEKEATLVVFSDVDFITDAFAFQKSIFGVIIINKNSALLLNTLDHLCGSSDLISIRAKGEFQRPFKVVDKIEEAAEKATEAKVAEINEKIQHYQEELNKLQADVTDQNVALLRTEGLLKRKELEKKIEAYQRELQVVKRERRQEIESLGHKLQAINTILVPSLILLFSIVLAITRYVRKKSFAGGAYEG